MRTVKVTQIGDSLGIVLPNSDAVVLPDETVSNFRLKQGDSVVISRYGKYADSYRVSFHTVKIGGTIRLVKTYQGYRASNKQLKKYPKIWKVVKRSRLGAALSFQTPASKCVHQQLMESAESTKSSVPGNSYAANVMEQLELGREFMREFHETFQALAS